MTVHSASQTGGRSHAESPHRLLSPWNRTAALPSGPEERFAGYGVMGVPFSSGYVLALRHFPASSVGPGYSSVWIRDPAGVWTMHSTTEPRDLLPPLLRQRPRIGVDGRDFHPVARRLLLQRGGRRRRGPELGPDAGGDADHPAHVRGVRRRSGAAVAQPDVPARHGGRRRPGAGGGAHRIDGQRCPTAKRFGARPRRMWFVRESTARAQGAQPGTDLRPLPVQDRLGDFWIPQRGIFMIGSSVFEPFDPAADH